MTRMKTAFKYLSMVAGISLIVWALCFIYDEGKNAPKPSAWGIAKDNPIR